MNTVPLGPSRSELAVDEVIAESFPASDSPAWNPTHAGMPVRPPWPAGHREAMQAQILTDLERLGRRFDPDERIQAREDRIAQAILDAGCAVSREPLGDTAGMRNLEAEILGTEPHAACVVVGARYDVEDASRVAMLLAVIRAMVAVSPVRRTVRFVALVDSPSVSGPLRYADRLQAEGKNVHVMVSIGTMALASDSAAVMFAFGWGSWSLGSVAGHAFRHASSVRAKILPFVWWPGLYASDYVALSRRGWRAMMVADVPGRKRDKQEPNLDRMAAAASGLVASVRELAQ